MILHSVLIALLCLSTCALGVQIPLHWKTLIDQLCKEFEKNSNIFPDILDLSPSAALSLQVAIPTSFPPIIIWSPTDRFEKIREVLHCPKCDVQGQNLVACSWTISDQHQPRCIYSTDVNVLLISRIYKCPINHTVYAHHPAVLRELEQLGLKFLIPFLLWHITGFTTEIVQSVVGMIDGGFTVSQVEKYIKNRYHIRESIRHQQYNSLCKLSGMNFEVESTTARCLSPTRHSLIACYLLNFWTQNDRYCAHMACRTVSRAKCWLSCDHTFKSVANIGYVRKEDRKWVTQYKGMMCIQNGDGEVLSWMLVKDLCFDSVSCMLTALKNRLAIIPSHFVVDNCCQWRTKLKTIFGNDLIVKLDVFHAVQRISKKIPKRHKYHSECMHALRLVFREPSDRGKERTQPTPSPTILLENIQKFQHQWSGISHEGKLVLPSAAINELTKLKYHVQKGCLSSIEPGMGTNRNERLHRDLNSVFTNSKYGVEYAYALLTTTFYRHNEEIVAKRECRDPFPIEMHETLPSTGETFGLSSPLSIVDHQETDITMSPNHSSRPYHEVTYDELENEVKILLLLDEKVFDSDEYITLEEAVDILLEACRYHFVHSELLQKRKGMNIEIHELPLYSCYPHVTFKSPLNEQFPVTNEQLSHTLSAWGFDLVRVEGDGNCLFMSIAQSVAGDESTKLSLGLDYSQGNQFVSSQLRHLMVEEWLGEHLEYYQAFLPQVCLQEEGEKYRTNGTFAGDLGDLMVVTLANIIRRGIVIFTSNPQMPVLTVTPAFGTVENIQPIWLAYSHDGPGHYDLATPNNSQEEKRSARKKCNCGRQKSYYGPACTRRSNDVEKLRTKCPCYRSNQPCSSSCRCSNCQNPNGQRQRLTTRIRHRYSNQKQPLKGRPTTQFVEESHEDPLCGSLSSLEHCLIKCITIFMFIHEIDYSPETVSSIFSFIYELTKSVSSVQFPIYLRSTALIKSTLELYFKHFIILQKLQYK